jgi:2,4-dienoyl-CoA reductase-like NADH-dependent reductase (Old Yellow Enzyme family)
MCNPTEGNGCEEEPVTTPIAELEHVWTPLSIGATTVKHRIMVTGHTQLYGEHHVISDRHVAYYRERAKGGAALLILEQQAAHPAGMNYHQGCVAFDERAVPAYRALGEAVHEFGCKQFVQLFCCGSQGRSTMFIDNFRPLWAPSRIPSIVYNEVPMVMEQRHIDETVASFGQSAANVKAAGLDGVEIHAAHNQLVGEFLSPGTNRRDDAYGGSLENRCRFLVEIGEEIRRRCGDDFTVGVRVSFDEYLGPGHQTPELSEQMLDHLAERQLFDFFDISAGGYHTLHVAVSPMGALPEGFMRPFARQAKEAVGDRAKVFVVGRILDLRLAEEILAGGEADMVAMTRAHMADPFVVAKSREGREREIVRCIGANVCVSRLVADVHVTCVFNPAMGREAEWGDGTLTPVNGGARSIGVVGGGPAGLSFAAVAARRGHRVTLFEASDTLGGRLRQLAQLPTRENWRIGIDNLVFPVEDAGVDVRLGTEATRDSLLAGGFDAIVCANGSTWERAGDSPFRPDRRAIPGTEQDNVVTIDVAIARALADPGSLGQRVLILDETQDYLPLGLAELLRGAGVDVEVVSPHFFVGAELLPTLDMAHVVPRLKSAGIVLTAQTFVERIAGGAVELYDVWGGPRRTVEIDTLVMCAFRRPSEELYQSLADSDVEVHRVGDAVAPRKLEAIVHEGQALGRAI